VAGPQVLCDDPTSGNIILGLFKLLYESAQDNIAAGGTTQANAYLLQSEMSRVTVAANTSAPWSGVMLPSTALVSSGNNPGGGVLGSKGLTVYIINHASNPIQVFGMNGDTVDDQTSSVGVTQIANSSVLYTCHSSGAWYSNGLATGFSKGLGLQTLASANVAGSTTITQNAGTPIVSMLNNVTGTGAVAATLPASALGLEIIVHNTSTGACSVFPATGETINSGAANAALSMPAGTSATFTVTTVGAWLTVPRTPS